MITREKLIHHVEHLREKHDNLDKRIVEEETRHGNCAEIAILKKQKLKLKDEIEQTNKRINNMQ